jgi:hypothetical protein
MNSHLKKPEFIALSDGPSPGFGNARRIMRRPSLDPEMDSKTALPIATMRAREARLNFEYS